MDTFTKIANFLSGACNEQEIAELEAWRKAEPANEKEFRKFEKIWNSDSKSCSFNPDVAKAWDKVSACLFSDDKNIETAVRNNLPFRWQSYWKVAAAVSLLFLAGFVYFMMQTHSVGTNLYNGLAKQETGTHQRKEFILPDGSLIWLNKNSQVYYPEEFEEQERIVHLIGEAFFEVTANPEKPFRIIAGAGEVQVLGTSFNVNSREKENLKVQVVSGKVQLAVSKSPESSVVLNSGEAAEINGGTIKSIEQDKNFISWKTGAFIFENTDLQEVLNTLENYYPVAFTTVDDELLNCRLSAQFNKQTLEEVLQILDITLNLKHHYNEAKDEVTFTFSGNGVHCSGINP